MDEQEARAIAAPGAWNWPMSEEAKAWVHNCRVYEQQKRAEALTPEQQADYDGWFNRAGHDAFMRSLG